MILELFLTTVKEYKRFMERLPINENDSLVETIYNASNEDNFESDYIAIQVRLMLIRKYINKNENVYIEKMIDEAKELFPNNIIFLDEINREYLQLFKKSFELIYSNGIKNGIFESIENVMYGLYLHADEERIIRLSHTKESFRIFYLKRFVLAVEKIIIKIYNFLVDKGVSVINEQEHNKAPVIHLGEQGKTSQNIKGSPYWENLYGHDITDQDVEVLFGQYLQEDSNDEKEIYMKVHYFLNEITKDNVSIEKLREIVFVPTIDDWGDFTEAISYYKQITNPGLSSKIRFNNKKNVAYMIVVPKVDGGFVIDSPHIMSNLNYITLIMDDNINEWRVFAFGHRPINPFK